MRGAVISSLFLVTALGALGCGFGVSGSSGGSGGATSGTGSGTTTGVATTTGSGTGGNTAGCPAIPSDVGGPCVTTIDCLSGLVCTSDHGGGSCRTKNTTPILECLAAGASCGDTQEAPCCGICANGQCKDPASSPCASYSGAACLGDSDCCAYLACTGIDGGTLRSCQPSCGQVFAHCDPAHGDGDCCTVLGYRCQGYGVSGGGPYYCNALHVVPPGGGCSSTCVEGWPGECQLGSPCDPSVLPLDNCRAAGLICDTTNDVCTAPSATQECLEDGPPCVANGEFVKSNVTLTCAWNPYFALTLCAQVCKSTSDCISPFQACCTSCTPSICVGVYHLSPCSTFFGPCDAQAAGDGICEPINISGTVQGDCVQATLVGGGPGQSCTFVANRENLGFCDTADTCSLGGICVPVCNAGTRGDHPCPGGARQRCVSENGISSDEDDFGYCLTNCDPFAPGACLAVDGGAPQVCVPGIFYGFADDGTGVCIGQVASPLPLGAVCAVYDERSVCVAGAACVGDLSDGGIGYCAQPCRPDGGCPGWKSCLPIESSKGVRSTMIGYCI